MCGDGPGRSTWGWAPGAEQTYTPLLDAGPLVGKWPNIARGISGGNGDGQLPAIFARLGQFAKSPEADARGAAAAGAGPSSCKKGRDAKMESAAVARARRYAGA